MSSVLAKRPREEDNFGDYGHKKTRLDQNSNTSFFPARFPFNKPALSPPPQPTEPSVQASLQIKNNKLFENTLPDPFLQWREEKKQSHSSLQHRRPPTLTLDTAMEIDMAQPSPFPTGDNLSPWPVSAKNKAFSNYLQPSPIPHHLLNQSLTISGGRTSTPIYSHFTLNMNKELMVNSTRDATSTLPTPTAQDSSEANWWRRRRLPSPISEAGDVPELDSTNTAGKEAGHSNDWPDSPSSMDVDDDKPSNMYLQAPEPNQRLATRTPVEVKSESTVSISITSPSSSSSSASTVSTKAPSITVPKREKISFSMGYRADCEKCQMKVPGHYSHIVRS